MAAISWALHGCVFAASSWLAGAESGLPLSPFAASVTLPTASSHSPLRFFCSYVMWEQFNEAASNLSLASSPPPCEFSAGTMFYMGAHPGNDTGFPGD